MDNKIVFITGATSGIGQACAEKFATNKFNLIITGRREKRLLELQDKLEKNFSVKIVPLAFDVRRHMAVQQAIDDLPEEWKQVDILINNAGLAQGMTSIEEGNIDDWDAMIDTNVKGLLYVSRAIMPLMVKKNRGHIFNIGSTAGKDVYPKGNVYCASKHAVDAISKAMRIDLLPHNIKVTAVHPGAAETEFSLVRFKGDAQKASDVYKGYEPLSAEDIAEVIYFCANLPAHVCINDLVITPTQQANANFIFKK